MKNKLFYISRILLIIIILFNMILVVLNYIRIGMFNNYDGIGVSLSLASLDNKIPLRQYHSFIESLYDDMKIQLIFLACVFVLVIIVLVTNRKRQMP